MNYLLLSRRLLYPLTDKIAPVIYLDFIEDKNLIDPSILNKNERQWINKYHKKVFDNLKFAMNKVEFQELEKACSPI